MSMSKKKKGRKLKMEKFILHNGMKLIYEKINGNITSFTIGLEAGANVEDEKSLGLAHVVEHMVFKGTRDKSEKDINEICSEVFGFHNAMTNYPYVVYYGTCLSEDFKKGLEVYSDLILNPTFPTEGFKEEIKVILEELKDWSDDLSQHCEDLLFYNAFESQRIKNLIIGKEELLRKFTIDDVKNFYKKYYKPSNTVISVVTSLSIEEVLSEVKPFFSPWGQGENNVDYLSKNTKESNAQLEIPDIGYEKINSGVYTESKMNINGGKLQYIFPIHHLSHKEIAILRVFNEVFAEGTNSILYEELRTKRGLVYDVVGKVKFEKGIKLYSIYAGASKENIEEVIKIIDNSLKAIKNSRDIFTKEKINRYIKSLKLKRTLTLEKSIVLSMYLAIYEIMFKDCKLLENEFNLIADINEDDIISVMEKVLASPAIQIIKPKNI